MTAPPASRVELAGSPPEAPKPEAKAPTNEQRVASDASNVLNLNKKGGFEGALKVITNAESVAGARQASAINERLARSGNPSAIHPGDPTAAFKVEEPPKILPVINEQAPEPKVNIVPIVIEPDPAIDAARARAEGLGGLASGLPSENHEFPQFKPPARPAEVEDLPPIRLNDITTQVDRNLGESRPAQQIVTEPEPAPVVTAEITPPAKKGNLDRAAEAMRRLVSRRHTKFMEDGTAASPAEAPIATMVATEASTPEAAATPPKSKREEQLEYVLAGNAKEQDLLQQLKERKPLKKSEGLDLVENNFGTEVDKTGAKKRTPEGKIIYGEAKQNIDVIQDLVEKGVGNLSDEQKTLAIAQVRQCLEGLDESRRLRWEGMDPAEVSAEIEPMMKDPDFINQVREGLGKLKEQEPIQDNVTEAKTRLEQAQRQTKSLNGEMAQITGLISSNRASAEEFADRTDRGGSKGAKLQELERIQAEMPTLIEDLAVAEGSLKYSNDQIVQLRISRNIARNTGKDVSKIDEQIRIQKENASNYEKEASTIRTRIETKTNLENQRAALMREAADLEDKRLELNEQQSEATEELNRANVEFSTAQGTRKVAENEFASDVRMLLPEATIAYAQKKLIAKEAKDEAERQEAIVNAKSLGEKAVLVGMARYNRMPPVEVRETKWHGLKKTSETRLVPGKYPGRVIEQDFRNLLKNNDPQALMRIVMTNARDSTGKYLMTNEQIEAQLKDKEFMDEMTPKVLAKLIETKQLLNPLTENEAVILGQSEWGANVIIAEAIKNPEIARTIETMRIEHGADNTKELLTKMSNESPGNILSLLMALFGAVAIGLTAVKPSELMGQPR